MAFLPVVSEMMMSSSSVLKPVCMSVGSGMVVLSVIRLKNK
jgi:hypothetical protein